MEVSHGTHERENPVVDNARKFVVAADGDISPLIGESGTYFTLITDWIEAEENNETKVVRKEYPDGTIQMLFISKETTNGRRVAVKEEISQDRYESYLSRSRVRVEKIRHEFTLEQGGVHFNMKYDRFLGDSHLRILEVDADTDEKRASFDPAAFPAANLVEVNDRSYEGYRVADKI